jgi:hypothetical protein
MKKLPAIIFLVFLIVIAGCIKTTGSSGFQKPIVPVNTPSMTGTLYRLTPTFSQYVPVPTFTQPAPPEPETGMVTIGVEGDGNYHYGDLVKFSGIDTVGTHHLLISVITPEGATAFTRPVPVNSDDTWWYFVDTFDLNGYPAGIYTVTAQDGTALGTVQVNLE